MNPMRLLERFLAKGEGGRDLRQVIFNTGWLFADRVIRLCVGVLVNVLAVRYLGPDAFGSLSYALAFPALFSAFAGLGLDQIVVREVVCHPEHEDEILGTAFFLKLAGGCLAFSLAVGSIVVARPHAPGMLVLVAVTATGLIFQAFDVVDFWFQSRIASKYAVYAKSTAFLVLAAVKLCLIYFQAPLLAFGSAAAAETVLGAVGLVVSYRANRQSLWAWRPSLTMAAALLQKSWPMIFTGLFLAVYMKIDLVMLGQLAGNAAVGIYSAALGISEVWYFIPMAVASSVAPGIIQLREADSRRYYQRLQDLFNLLVIVAYAIAVPVTFLARPLVLLLFGASFSDSGIVLAIHIWSAVFVFLGVARSIWIIAEGCTVVAMVTRGVGALLNVVLNLYLIPRYQAAGAAVATAVSYCISDYALFLLTPSLRKVGTPMTRALTLHFLFRRGKARAEAPINPV